MSTRAIRQPVSSREARVGASLEDEEPQNPSDDDVQLWLAIYTELILFTEEMLARTRERMLHLPGPAQRHVDPTNVGIMEEESRVFRERKSSFQGRRAQLVDP